MERKYRYYFDGKEIGPGNSINVKIDSGRERIINITEENSKEMLENLCSLGIVTKEEDIYLRYPSWADVMKLKKENCPDSMDWLLLNELRKTDQYIAFRFMLKGFSEWLQKEYPLTTIPGEKFSVYIVNSASGKIEPITVDSMEGLNNIPWFKSKDDAYYAISKLYDIYIKVYPNGNPK